MMNDKRKVIDRAVELLKNNPSLKYYEAIEIARREFHGKVNNSRGASSQR